MLCVYGEQPQGKKAQKQQLDNFISPCFFKMYTRFCFFSQRIYISLRGILDQKKNGFLKNIYVEKKSTAKNEKKYIY